MKVRIGLRRPSSYDVLDQIHESLRYLLVAGFNDFLRLGPAVRYDRETLEALEIVGLLQREFKRLLRDRSLDADRVMIAFQSGGERLQERVRTMKHAAPRRFLIKAWELLLGGQQRVDVLRDLPKPSSSSGATVDVTEVLVPSDLVYKFHRELFPAEQMMVVAGRRRDGRITFGAAFDVTGDAGGTHVRADPEKLAVASIAMDLSGTGLLGWVHSHPGVGPGATVPSDIDRRQHSQWLQRFSAQLVSVVLVKDGYIRFWGDAVEEGQVKVIVDGKGVIPEGTDGKLYRLQS